MPWRRPFPGDAASAGAAAYRAGDYAEAERIWRPLAEAGVPKAQFHLGAMYYEGRFGRRDLATAYAWVRRAAEQGYFRAPALLAQIETEMTAEQSANGAGRVQTAGEGSSQKPLGVEDQSIAGRATGARRNPARDGSTAGGAQYLFPFSFPR
jgi:TPR repeat protein